MIYCDLDGVLADFDGTFYKNYGIWPRKAPRKHFWQLVQKINNYWYNLDKMPDADNLANYLKNFNYKILTGCPQLGFTKAVVEKNAWVKQNISPHLEVIACLTKDKTNYCQRGDILIDDWPPNIEAWEKAGGIGILHTNAENTINQLKQLGYTPNNSKTGAAQSINITNSAQNGGR